jgi:hypothetical protein
MEKKSRYLKSSEDVIYDSVTSLSWMAKDSQLHLDKAVSWDEANEFAAEMNKKKFGGHNDWRMPTIHEALSIHEKDSLNKDSAGADIQLSSIFAPGGGNCTWTSQTRGREAQILFYINGFPYWYEKNDQTISHAVRLVRRD